MTLKKLVVNVTKTVLYGNLKDGYKGHLESFDVTYSEDEILELIEADYVKYNTYKNELIDSIRIDSVEID